MTISRFFFSLRHLKAGCELVINGRDRDAHRLTHHVLEMNGESCRLKQSAGRHRRAIGAEQNQITVALVEDEPADEPDSAATA